jgi:regulator of protease activity HflC (stomatin/prohibitin superfamily)
MTDQDINSLIDRTAGRGVGGFVPYLLVFVPLIFLSLVLFLASLFLPPPLDALASWSSALSGGLALAGFILLVLTAVWFRSRWLGRVVSVLLSAAWLSWLLLIPGSSAVLAAFVSLAGALVVLALGLYFVAGSLLPTPEEGGQRSEVFKLLADYLLRQNYPCYVVNDDPQGGDRIEKRVKGSPFTRFAWGSGVIISDADRAVAVSDGIRFKGVKGPGVIFTTFGDRPAGALDLRPQLRTLTARALTKDGIEVKVLFFAPFQIDRGRRRPRLGRPFPYRENAAFRAVLGQKIEHETDNKASEQRSWDELPQILGERVIQDILSGYHFDELYGPYEIDEKPPRIHIAKEFVRRLREELQPLGLYLVGGGIANIEPVEEEVLERRVRSWRADWTRRVMLKQARSQAERLRRIERARAEAQADLILTLGEMLAELDRPGVDVTPEKVVPEFLRVLEELALRPALRRYLPRGAAQEVRRLRAPFETEE